MSGRGQGRWPSKDGRRREQSFQQAQKTPVDRSSHWARSNKGLSLVSGGLALTKGVVEEL